MDEEDERTRRRQWVRNWENLCMIPRGRTDWRIRGSVCNVDTVKNLPSVLNSSDNKRQNHDMQHCFPVWPQKQLRHWSDFFPSQERAASIVFFQKHLTKPQLLRIHNQYLLLMCNHWHHGSMIQDYQKERGLLSETLLQSQWQLDAVSHCYFTYLTAYCTTSWH